MHEMTLIIPEKVDGLQLPDPYLLTYWQDEQERCFWSEGEISDSLYEISKQILRYNREDKGILIENRIPIKLFINSPGGDLDATMSFVQLVELSKTPVITVNAGMAYSAAGLILMSGHKRYAFPGSQCMIHSGSASGISGTFEQTASFMDNYKKLIDDMKKYILKKTTIASRMLNKKKTLDWYIDEHGMIDNHIVDEIVTDLDILF